MTSRLTILSSDLPPHLGLDQCGRIHRNLPTPALYEEALRRHEGILGSQGQLVVRTGKHTGRSPKDKFLVQEPSSQEKIWWGEINRPIDPTVFDRLQEKVAAYFHGREAFVTDGYAGAQTDRQLKIRVITTHAWHALFARNMFIREDDPQALKHFQPDYTVLHAPEFHAEPDRDGTHSGAFVLLHFAKKIVLIGGTSYAGEVKKSIFTVLNFIYPQQDILPMHCSANQGKNPDDLALFFGLSGTGKTTLSADPNRTLIGDDEHGWSHAGVFNFEGGCYAKVIHLSKEGEPQIYQATHRFGAILENVRCDPLTRNLDLDDDSLTENTRASYPIHHMPNAVAHGCGGHPNHIVMLTCDAFGVLPPISHLTTEQAMYYFLSGYTAKVAGTEAGITEPKAAFSPCFGAPFMALPPLRYTTMLGERIRRHRVDVWLVNTGWTRGPYGAGHRIELEYTRSMIASALNGRLDQVPKNIHPIFQLQIPAECHGVPSEILDPRNTWKNPEAYDQKARQLARMFNDNFQKLGNNAPEEIRQAGPRSYPKG